MEDEPTVRPLSDTPEKLTAAAGAPTRAFTSLRWLMQFRTSIGPARSLQPVVDMPFMWGERAFQKPHPPMCPCCGSDTLQETHRTAWATTVWCAECRELIVIALRTSPPEVRPRPLSFRGQ